MAGRGKRRDLRRKINGRMLLALARCEDDPKLQSLSDLLVDSLQTDVLGTLRTLAQFLPREIDVSIDSQTTLVHVLASINATSTRALGHAESPAESDTERLTGHLLEHVPVDE